MKSTLTAARSAKYFGCEVEYNGEIFEGMTMGLGGLTLSKPNWQINAKWRSLPDNIFLLLTPLSKISDEDLTEVGKIFQSIVNDGQEHSIEEVREILFKYPKYIPSTVADFLRSPEWNGCEKPCYDIDNAINDGWAKEKIIN